MSLESDLIRFVSRIAGKLVRVDGPDRDRRGICYHVGERKFRSYDAAVRCKQRTNERVRREAATP